jgi:hypothetical protein
MYTLWFEECAGGGQSRSQSLMLNSTDDIFRDIDS